MTEDQRVSRNTGEPAKRGPVGSARWAAYLDWMRTDVVDGVLALTPEQQRTSRVPSGWTPIELLSHVLHMEQRWFVWGFLGEPVEEPWGDWNTVEPWIADDSDETRPAARWLVTDGVTAEALAERLRAVGRRTTEVLAAHPLDAVAAAGGRFDSDPPTLEWICFHVLAEYARHAGHLDIVAELTDR
ncbi:DUF664 domain-containing protein [Nocardioides sp. InS609-2]|uniref:mycothiol transferase n=1 Tax=Nocardioides sp. InS609-2 TaxID=2760705 RepID=UPI0020C0CA8D|nr:DUF664 domain-containing protein [Nocardioides sp. InS609-2]